MELLASLPTRAGRLELYEELYPSEFIVHTIKLLNHTLSLEQPICEEQLKELVDMIDWAYDAGRLKQMNTVKAALGITESL